MLRVKTFVSSSLGRDLGLFAIDRIPSGTVTWTYDADFDRSFSMGSIDSLPAFSREVFLKYGYFDYSLNRLVVPIDDLRFINHSEKLFNIRSTPAMDVACKDIAAGEELLCNYRDYEHDYFERRLIDTSDWI